MSSRFVSAISRGWLAEEVYGYRAAQSISSCRMPYLYAKAMLVAAGGRSSAVAGLCSVHFAGAVDIELMNFVAHYDASNVSPACLETAARLDPANARVVVYDAMTAAKNTCASTSAASNIAAELGVEPETAAHIEDLCDREFALEARRRKMLFGDDTSVIA